jgi:hypothetical protein
MEEYATANTKGIPSSIPHHLGDFFFLKHAGELCLY